MTEPTDPRLVDPALLPDYSAWLASSPGLSLSGYAYHQVKLDHFFAVAAILRPEVIQHAGGLFQAEGFTTRGFDDWFRATSGDLTAIERVVNHRHVGDLLVALSDAPVPVLVSAGALIRECWEAHLKQLYPQVPTRVEMFCSDYDVEVTFVTVRS